MDTRFAVALIIVGALAGWGVSYAGHAVSLWKRLRGDRIIAGPENEHPAVQVNVARAITSDAGSDATPIESCSRWKDRGDCDQPAAHVGKAPEHSAPAQVKQWARGRQCVSCGGPLVESRLAGHHIALLEPSGMTREWVDVAADRLQ